MFHNGTHRMRSRDSLKEGGRHGPVMTEEKKENGGYRQKGVGGMRISSEIFPKKVVLVRKMNQSEAEKEKEVTASLEGQRSGTGNGVTCNARLP